MSLKLPIYADRELSPAGIWMVEEMTDSVSGGFTASFSFQPLPEATSEVQFTLPGTYAEYVLLYQKEMRIKVFREPSTKCRTLVTSNRNFKLNLQNKEGI